MKKLLFITFILLFVGCSLFEDEPDFTYYANVWDPNSDFYKPPETELIDPPPLILKNEHSTTFRWTSTRYGSPIDIDTSLVDTSKYANISWSYYLHVNSIPTLFIPDSTLFTVKDTIKTVSFTFLTDTSYTFYVRTHYPNGEIEDPPTHYEFRVDDIQGPALRFHPRKYDIAIVETSFIMEIYAEEVTGLTGAKIVLEYSLDSLTIGKIFQPDDQLFFLSPNGETTLFLESVRSDSDGIGTITINMALAGTDIVSVSGTGKLAIFTATPKFSGTSYLRISSESIFRNSDNEDIAIQDSSLVEGIIIAE